MSQTSIIIITGLIISIAIFISTIVIQRGQRQGQPMQQTPTPVSLQEAHPEIFPLQSATLPVSAPTDLTQLIEAIYDAAMKAQSNVQINNLHNFCGSFQKMMPERTRCNTARRLAGAMAWK
jgi:hypothetical protein